MVLKLENSIADDGNGIAGDKEEKERVPHCGTLCCYCIVVLIHKNFLTMIISENFITISSEIS